MRSGNYTTRAKRSLRNCCGFRGAARALSGTLPDRSGSRPVSEREEQVWRSGAAARSRDTLGRSQKDAAVTIIVLTGRNPEPRLHCECFIFSAAHEDCPAEIVGRCDAGREWCALELHFENDASRKLDGQGASARPVQRVDQAIGVRDEPVVLLRELAALSGERVVLRDELGPPGVDLTPKIGELGIEAVDLRVHGLEP